MTDTAKIDAEARKDLAENLQLSGGPAAQLKRFLTLEDILIGFPDGIDGARLEAGLTWAKHGSTKAGRADLISLFASRWQAAQDSGEWTGDAMAEGEKDLKEVTAAALAGAGERVERAIANLRSDIADAIPYGLTYVSSDDPAVVMDALALRAREGDQPVAWRFRGHPSNGWVYTSLGGRHDGCEVQPLYAHPAAPSADKLREFGRLFKALRDESWDLRCFSVPTGGDDADIGWRVIGHWQAEPRERTIAEVFSDDPAEAVRQALTAPKAEGA